MSHDMSISDLRKRLDDLEERLAGRASAAEKFSQAASYHKKRIAEIHVGAAAMRKKLEGTDESNWGSVKHGLEAGLETLTKSFEHWIEHVDEDYRSRKP